jgi:hypothetical protein
MIGRCRHWHRNSFGAILSTGKRCGQALEVISKALGASRAHEPGVLIGVRSICAYTRIGPHWAAAGLVDTNLR